MRKSESKVIEGHKYTVTQFGALQGRAVITQLIKMVGGIYGLVNDVGGSIGKLSEEEFGTICDAFSKFTDVEVSPGKAPRLSDIFDEHFAGEYSAMFSWLLFAVEVNFGSFFEKALGAKLSDLKVASLTPGHNQKDSSPRQEPTGKSGDS